MKRSIARYSICIALGSASLALAGGAAAQSFADNGITVYGRVSPYEQHPMLSQRVSYRDLDLSTRAGVQTLKWRVRQTANALCARLGERPGIEQNTTVLPSCQAAARDSASIQIGKAVQAARYRTDYAYYR
jgi:UrcA family protein